MTEDLKPLEDWLALRGNRVGLVFSDIVDSTLLLFQAETLNFRGLIRSHRSRANGLIKQFDGRLVEFSGDGTFSAFPRAIDAFSFASELLRDPGHAKIRLRAGVHFGRVHAEGNGLIGRDVHLGARVAEHAGDDQLWVSDTAKLMLESESPTRAAEIDWLAHEDCDLKGVPESKRLWRATSL